jgi:hypothetical protein
MSSSRRRFSPGGGYSSARASDETDLQGRDARANNFTVITGGPGTGT